MFLGPRERTGSDFSVSLAEGLRLGNQCRRPGRWAPGESGHHPLPCRAHTYLGPDTVCGSEAGGLRRKEGGGRGKAGRECPGAWPGGAPRPAPLHSPGQAGGWAVSPVPFPGLPPAPRSQPQPFCDQEPASVQAGGGPAPQLHRPPFRSTYPPNSRHHRHLGQPDPFAPSPPPVHVLESAQAHSLLCAPGPPHSLPLCTRRSPALVWHARHFCALVPCGPLHLGSPCPGTHPATLTHFPAHSGSGFQLGSKDPAPSRSTCTPRHPLGSSVTGVFAPTQPPRKHTRSHAHFTLRARAQELTSGATHLPAFCLHWDLKHNP